MKAGNHHSSVRLKTRRAWARHKGPGISMFCHHSWLRFRSSSGHSDDNFSHFSKTFLMLWCTMFKWNQLRKWNRNGWLFNNARLRLRGWRKEKSREGEALFRWFWVQKLLKSREDDENSKQRKVCLQFETLMPFEHINRRWFCRVLLLITPKSNTRDFLAVPAGLDWST